VSPQRDSELGYACAWENNDLTPSDAGNKVVISFTEMLLDILHRSLPSDVIELEQALS
jgi:zinc finger FYVE domain-containing protein 26